MTMLPLLLLLTPQWIELTLERESEGAWKPAPPGLVLETGSRDRYRYQTPNTALVYVVNHGSSGARKLLFPAPDSGMDNHVRQGTSYLVPSTEAAFRVSGPEGHDIVYWILSPRALGEAEALALAREAAPPARLLPRCDDSVLRARGECVDTQAGPRLVSRELTIVQKDERTRVGISTPPERPLVYQYRIPHR